MTAKRTTKTTAPHKWDFTARFRRHAFGWKSQPAIGRIKQAVSEIRKVARRDPVLAAEGAVLFLERVSPAIEHVDGSSGAIGTAVNRAIDALVPIIAAAPADATIRDAWLERLWDAHASDEIPYIERLADHWGELCGGAEVASAWADRLLGVTRMALSPDKSLRSHFHGTTACLAALSCPVCHVRRLARRVVRQWRCGVCVDAGLEGRLEVVRWQVTDAGHPKRRAAR